MHQLDDIDKKILKELYANARQTNQEIAKKIGVAASTLTKRIQWLESQKVIQGYTCRVDPDALGFPTIGFTLLRFTDMSVENTNRVLARLKQIKEVAEIYKILGDDDVIVKIFARNNKNYQQVVESLAPSGENEKYHTKTLLTTEVIYEDGLAGVIEKIDNGDMPAKAKIAG